MPQLLSPIYSCILQPVKQHQILRVYSYSHSILIYSKVRERREKYCTSYLSLIQVWTVCLFIFTHKTSLFFSVFLTYSLLRFCGPLTNQLKPNYAHLAPETPVRGAPEGQTVQMLIDVNLRDFLAPLSTAVVCLLLRSRREKE